MSDSVTLPEKLALTGPMRMRTFAFISVSDVFSSDSHPGMQACSTTGSLSAAKTLSRGAATLYSPLISMMALPVSDRRMRLPFAGIGVRRRFCQWFADRDVNGREVAHG